MVWSCCQSNYQNCFSPEVISNTPNRNKNTPKVIFVKCTPKVGQKTFGVYYVKEETQEAQPI